MISADPNHDDRESFVGSIESIPWLVDLAESGTYTNSMALLADDAVLVHLDGSYEDSWVLAIQTAESPEDPDGLVVLGLQHREVSGASLTTEMQEPAECSLTDLLTAAQLISLAKHCRTIKFIETPLLRDSRPIDLSAYPIPVRVWVWDLVSEQLPPED